MIFFKKIFVVFFLVFAPCSAGSLFDGFSWPGLVAAFQEGRQKEVRAQEALQNMSTRSQSQGFTQEQLEKVKLLMGLAEQQGVDAGMQKGLALAAQEEHVRWLYCALAVGFVQGAFYGKDHLSLTDAAVVLAHLVIASVVQRDPVSAFQQVGAQLVGGLAGIGVHKIIAAIVHKMKLRQEEERIFEGSLLCK